MSNAFDLGSEIGDFFRGILGVSRSAEARSVTQVSRLHLEQWGSVVDTSNLELHYAPRTVNPYEMPAGGIDNLSLTSRDVFVRPGVGESEVAFSGYFQVARSDPTTSDWATGDVFVNLTDIALTGEDANLGPIRVRPNRSIVSGGQTFAPGVKNRAAACRIAAAVLFEAPDAGVTLFNKEPILLMNEGIHSIPPVEDPNGHAFIYRLPLYDVSSPDSAPLAYLLQLRYTVGDYVTRDEADDIRALISA
jgi:hypothetical protein